MPVILRHSRDLSPLADHRHWLAVGPIAAPPDETKRLADVPRRLEAAFDSIREEWWELGRALAAEPTGGLSHAASCATSPSDMGAMLAWARLVEDLAGGPDAILAVCDDAWLFRHLESLTGVDAGAPPFLWPRALGLWLRGFPARVKVALWVAGAAVRLARQRRHHEAGGSFLLVYGHPDSDAEGRDAYFGTLMRRMPGVGRVLHTDCPPGRAAELGADRRTAGLHAWGSPLFALGLIFCRWRPSATSRGGPFAWLVRRAAAREGAGGAAAMTRWQMHCQRRWLVAVRPAAVVWPWENHPWERDFVRAAGARGTRTAGYLHTVVGPHMYNQSPRPNPDGLESIPGLILCNGPAYRADLERMGMPAERLVTAGAFRFAPAKPIAYDPAGPVFVALSSNLTAARQMLAAVRKASENGRRFLVKTHPMYPFDFAETDTLVRTPDPLSRQEALSGVLYCASVVGLEAVLAGLPTIRFRTAGGIAMNVLPDGVSLPTADADSLEARLAELAPPPAVAWDDVFAPVSMPVWRDFLARRGTRRDAEAPQRRVAAPSDRPGAAISNP